MSTDITISSLGHLLRISIHNLREFRFTLNSVDEPFDSIFEQTFVTDKADPKRM